MKIAYTLGVGVAAISLLLGGCGKEQPAATGASSAAVAEDVVVKIGSVAPLTGPQSHLGKDNDNGVRLAFEEISLQGLTIGGKKVVLKLISEDDQADPKTATIVAQKLADDKVNAVIGHLNSGTTIPASRIYNDAGIPQISPSATAIQYTAQGFKGAFRVMTNDSQQGKVLGEYAAKNLRAKRVAIIDDRTAYGQGLADEFEKAVRTSGASVVGREYTTDRSTDFLAILTGIKSKKPDLVFYGGMEAQAAPMVKQMATLGLKAQFLAGDGVRSEQFLETGGADAEGVVASSPGVPLEKMSGGQAFVTKFEAKYGKIQLYAPYAYDAVYALIEAMKKADSVEPAKYLPELAKINRNGVTGEIAFDEKGDIRDGAVTLYQVKNGAWTPLETVAGQVPGR